MDVHEQRTEQITEAAPPAAPPPSPYPSYPPGQQADLVGRPVAEAPVAPVPAARGRYVHTSYISSMPVGYRARQLLWLVYGVVAAFLVLDLIFHAAGANTASAFVTFVYNVGGAFNAPFRNIFTGERPGVSTIEWADVIALAVYAFATWVVERVIMIMRTPSRPPSEPY